MENTLEITKYGHACLAFEKDGHRIVIDPGGLTPEAATIGAEALLITHEHTDHFLPEKVLAARAANPELQVYANTAVAAQLPGLGDALHIVGHGDALEIGGFQIQVHGEWHALIHQDIPLITNVGFLIDGSFFHPGDALTVPETAVDTLLVPISGPWAKVGELVDWVREVSPRRTIAIHEALLSEIGLGLLDRILGADGPGTGAEYRRLAPGESANG